MAGGSIRRRAGPAPWGLPGGAPAGAGGTGGAYHARWLLPFLECRSSFLSFFFHAPRCPPPPPLLLFPDQLSPSSLLFFLPLNPFQRPPPLPPLLLFPDQLSLRPSDLDDFRFSLLCPPLSLLCSLLLLLSGGCQKEITTASDRRQMPVLVPIVVVRGVSFFLNATIQCRKPVPLTRWRTVIVSAPGSVRQVSDEHQMGVSWVSDGGQIGVR